MATVRKYARSRGRRKARLYRRAASMRRRLVRRRRKNRFKARNPSLTDRMPKRYRAMLDEALSTRDGRAALARYRKFTGLPWPTDILVYETPGKGKRTLVGMGRTPQVVIAKRRGEKPRRVRKSGMVCTDSRGKRIVVLSGRDSRDSKQKLRFLGYAAETHYIPSAAEERAGTFKAGKYWVHKHDDEGGRWPKVYADQAGNIVYGKGTYHVSDWIRR